MQTQLMLDINLLEVLYNGATAEPHKQRFVICTRLSSLCLQIRSNFPPITHALIHCLQKNELMSEHPAPTYIQFAHNPNDLIICETVNNNKKTQSIPTIMFALQISKLICDKSKCIWICEQQLSHRIALHRPSSVSY